MPPLSDSSLTWQRVPCSGMVCDLICAPLGGRSGLEKAVKLLEPIKEKVPIVSWADLMQLASATAIEVHAPRWACFG